MGDAERHDRVLADRAMHVDSPMQHVRLDTAHGHILLSDPATRDDGLSVFDDAAQVARQYGLSHQLRSIEGIRRSCDGPSAVLSR